MSTNTRWTDELLNQALKIGDPLLDDKLMPEIFGRNAMKDSGEAAGKCPVSHKEHGYKTNRLEFNLLMDVASKLLEEPELAFTRGSEVKALMEAMPEDFVDYFEPIPAPDWVDEEKLDIAAQLWEDNSFPMLMALGPASLAYCYMISNAIPTLYDTKKLADKKFMYQRVYETGIFADSVMRHHGLRVFEDFDVAEDKYWLDALQATDPDGDWCIAHGRLHRQSGKPDGHEDHGHDVPDPDKVQQLVAEFREQHKKGRYIWGPGFVNARKVRFLHATMRYMLMNPGSIPKRKQEDHDKHHSPMDSHHHAAEPFDVEKYGVPICQEDTAYTLMTFSLVLYECLEYLGRRVTDEQKHAILHQWKVIGYIMGVQEEYLTDDPAEGKELMLRVQERWAKATDTGFILTDALLDWVGTLLPPVFGYEKHFPTLLCQMFLGKKMSEYVLRPERANPPIGKGGIQMMFWRPVSKVMITAIRFSYWIADNFLGNFRHTSELTDQLLHRTVAELISSFRGPWARKPFWLPLNDTTWKRVRGATPEFQETLDHWRRRVFTAILGAVGCLMLTDFAALTWLGGVVWYWEIFNDFSNIALGVTGAAFIGYLTILSQVVPRILDKRPKLPESPPAKK